jgi:hypothetical protein
MAGPTLQRFWFRFSPLGAGRSHGLGCGVTAYSREDVISILRSTVFHGEDLPEIREVLEDVDIGSLDQNHVRPNMEVPVWRGVWFPKGFSFPADRENPWRR